MMPTKTSPDAEEKALDAVNPATHPSRDASHFRQIIAAARQADDAEDELRAAVQAARDAGDSWTIIGAALGTTKQAAQQRFGS
jgi:FAD/FMN-containing dehydrogenase